MDNPHQTLDPHEPRTSTLPLLSSLLSSLELSLSAAAAVSSSTGAAAAETYHPSSLPETPPIDDSTLCDTSIDQYSYDLAVARKLQSIIIPKKLTLSELLLKLTEKQAREAAFETGNRAEVTLYSYKRRYIVKGMEVYGVGGAGGVNVEDKDGKFDEEENEKREGDEANEREEDNEYLLWKKRHQAAKLARKKVHAKRESNAGIHRTQRRSIMESRKNSTHQMRASIATKGHRISLVERQSMITGPKRNSVLQGHTSHATSVSEVPLQSDKPAVDSEGSVVPELSQLSSYLDTLLKDVIKHSNRLEVEFSDIFHLSGKLHGKKIPIRKKYRGVKAANANIQKSSSRAMSKEHMIHDGVILRKGGDIDDDEFDDDKSGHLSAPSGDKSSRGGFSPSSRFNRSGQHDRLMVGTAGKSSVGALASKPNIAKSSSKTGRFKGVDTMNSTVSSVMTADLSIQGSQIASQSIFENADENRDNVTLLGTPNCRGQWETIGRQAYVRGGLKVATKLRMSRQRWTLRRKRERKMVKKAVQYLMMQCSLTALEKEELKALKAAELKSLQDNASANALKTVRGNSMLWIQELLKKRVINEFDMIQLNHLIARSPSRLCEKGQDSNGLTSATSLHVLGSKIHGSRSKLDDGSKSSYYNSRAELQRRSSAMLQAYLQPSSPQQMTHRDILSPAKPAPPSPAKPSAEPLSPSPRVLEQIDASLDGNSSNGLSSPGILSPYKPKGNQPSRSHLSPKSNRIKQSVPIGVVNATVSPVQDTSSSVVPVASLSEGNAYLFPTKPLIDKSPLTLLHKKGKYSIRGALSENSPRATAAKHSNSNMSSAKPIVEQPTVSSPTKLVTPNSSSTLAAGIVATQLISDIVAAASTKSLVSMEGEGNQPSLDTESSAKLQPVAPTSAPPSTSSTARWLAHRLSVSMFGSKSGENRSAVALSGGNS